jgi:hypothetical protein
MELEFDLDDWGLVVEVVVLLALPFQVDEAGVEPLALERCVGSGGAGGAGLVFGEEEGVSAVLERQPPIAYPINGRLRVNMK